MIRLRLAASDAPDDVRDYPYAYDARGSVTGFTLPHRTERHWATVR